MYFQTQDSSGVNDTPGEIDFNPGFLLERLDSWLDGFVRLLPNIAFAIIVIMLFYVLANVVKRIVLRRAKQRDRTNLGSMLSSFVKYTIIAIGFILGLTIIVPTLNPGDLVAGLGVSSVAIGFAFKDILQNWLAGLLILIRQPFEIDDQIEVNGFEGTVERIETRATIIRTYSHQRVVVPNSDIYTNAVKVNTANAITRSQYDVGIAYGENVEETVSLLQQSLSEVPGIADTKPIEVLPWELAASWVTLRIRWWTKSDRASVVRGRMHMIAAIKQALDAADVDRPYETKVQLIYDQTETTQSDQEAEQALSSATHTDQPPLNKKEQQ